MLSLKDITKTYPGVLANDRVSFDVQPGEIHALLGENGAGKSTLVKIIYGIIQPDSGSMLMNGATFHPQRPSEARAQGVGMVFQHFSLFEGLTVGENVAVGINADAVEQNISDRVREISTNYGLPLNPDRIVGDLSVGERQRVEIVRCLLQNPRLLIMDEPTSVLTPQEVGTLFETLRQLAAEGCSILYISHKLDEIRALCAAATVMRNGRVVGSCDPRRETAKSLAEMMIGETLRVAQPARQKPGEVRLKINNLSVQSEDIFGVDIADVNLTVRAGEVVGIAGVAGNGQDELMAALVGEIRANSAGAIEMNGVALGLVGPSERRRAKMGFVPEERLGHSGAPEMSLWENALMTTRTIPGFQSYGILNNSLAREFSRNVMQRFKVKAAGVESEAKSLSGGNLQKFLMGREIIQTPDVLVVSQPTWGVDAGSAAAIHQEILDLAAAGKAVLVISHDLDELMTICSRLVVIAGGRVSDSIRADQVTQEEVGRLMGGKAMAEAIHGQA